MFIITKTALFQSCLILLGRLDNLPLDTTQTHILYSSELCEMFCVICMIIAAGFRNSHVAWFQRKQQNTPNSNNHFFFQIKFEKYAPVHTVK